MIVTFLRSSALGSYSLCPFQFYLSYQLGLPQRPNQKTEMGSLVHKALELLAQRKKCEQDGTTSFADPELARTFVAAEVTPVVAIDAAWNHYAGKNESKSVWSDEHLATCTEWTNMVLEFNGGMFNPLLRKIVCPEQYFELTIDEPWATYDYKDPHTGESVRGKLGIKGSVDLVTEVSPGILEYVDLKTGRPRWDWAKNREKTYRDLQHDPQFLLYFYALTRLYPEARAIFFTVFYTQEGPFSVCYEKSRHVPIALNLLRKRFEQMKYDYAPKLIANNPITRWKCNFCSYQKQKWPGSSKSQCSYIASEVKQIGLERVMKKYGKPNCHSSYGSGGGVSNRDEKEKTIVV